MESKYRVEQGDKGCNSCGHGATWDVIGPDGIALGTSYFEKEDAEEMADLLNDALELGRAEPRS